VQETEEWRPEQLCDLDEVVFTFAYKQGKFINIAQLKKGKR
jgi:hypothetical protein